MRDERLTTSQCQGETDTIGDVTLSDLSSLNFLSIARPSHTVWQWESQKQNEVV